MTSPLSLLIVEDESLIAMMLEDYCLELGHHVRGVAGSVRSALELVAAGDFDAAIVDLKLENDAPSTPVLDQLSAAAIPFILASGGGHGDLPERHRNAPKLAKPFTIGALQDALDSLA